jgi:hypothetical protein
MNCTKNISELISFIDNHLEGNINFFSDKNEEVQCDFPYDLSRSSEEIQEEVLDGAKNLTEWVHIRSYCKKSVIEKCALKILKKNLFNSHLFLNYFYYSAEENILRYIFKTTVKKNNGSHFFLPPLEKLTGNKKVIEKVKSVFNSRYFKIPFLVFVCFTAPNFSGLYLQQIAPFVALIAKTHMPLQAIRILSIVNEWRRSLFLVSFCGDYLTLKVSYLNKTFSYIGKVVCPFSMHSSMCFYPDLTNVYCVYLVISKEFRLHSDRNAECENLFVDAITTSDTS